MTEPVFVQPDPANLVDGVPQAEPMLLPDALGDPTVSPAPADLFHCALGNHDVSAAERCESRPEACDACCPHEGCNDRVAGV